MTTEGHGVRVTSFELRLQGNLNPASPLAPMRFVKDGYEFANAFLWRFDGEGRVVVVSGED